MTNDPGFSRRSFIRSLGAILTLVTLPLAAFAQSTETVTQPTDTVSLAVPDDATLHKVLCANILLASSAHDGKPAAWSNRKDLCIGVIKKQDADIVCMQEVLRGQAQDVAEAMPDYASFGFAGPEMDAYPDNDYHGVTKNVIMYRKDRYDFVSAGGYWLSETPLIAASVSWDALRGRHVNWVRLKDKETGRDFRVIDTHFDHKGQNARVEQAKMVVKEAAQYAPDFPQILCGDFNADLKNPAIQTILAGGWKDTYKAVHGVEEPGKTFHGLKGPNYKTKSTSGKIDFIFTKGPVEAKSAEIIKDHEGDRYPSDHYFVSAEVRL